MSPVLALPLPDRLPADWAGLIAELEHADLSIALATVPAAPTSPSPALPVTPAYGRARLPPPNAAAEAEQTEHDRYFAVRREGGFVAGVVNAYTRTYGNCVDMGVTLLDPPAWARLFEGLTALSALRGPDAVALPPLPQPAVWRDGYDPALRWLIGHQLFFALIQGAIVGLHCFASAQPGAADGADAADPAVAAAGLALGAAFMRSSAEAMRFTTDFDPADYDITVRPAMAPPAVREGFSGLQTRDHAYLVRLFAALKPSLAQVSGTPAHAEFVEAVVSAYAAHEFICGRFRGDVLPSLRMAAHSRGKSQRPGVEVIRDMMRARLALVDPAGPDPA